MFKVFFDESGTHANSSAVVVAGYISSEEQCEQFDREWTQLLRQERVSALHRVDIENFRREFASNYGWDRARQVRVLQAAHDIIKRRTTIGTGGALIQADYEAVMPLVVKRAFGTAYGWLVHECIVGVGHWAERDKHPSLIQYVFEAGARGRHHVDRIFKSLESDPKYRHLCRIGGWAFLSKDSALELQAADFLAYEVHKHVVNRIVASPARRPIRRSALDLIRRGDQVHYWDAARFRRWVESAARFISILEDRERNLRALGRANLI